MEVQAPVTGEGARQGETATVTYYFDAVIALDHLQNLEATQHPIQAGSSIVDHAYLTPAEIVLDVAMSDSVDRFSQGIYTSDKSKSVSFYKTLLALQSSRAPVTLNTRLKRYDSLYIKNIRAHDTNATIAGFRGTIWFRELIVGVIASQPNNVNAVSARPDQTATNNEGTKQPQPVPPDLQPYLDVLR
jgi:hypothetical protein